MVDGELTLVIFDFDGTLCDSATTIIRQMRRACTDIGVPAPAAEMVRANIGLGVEHVAHLYTNNDAEKSVQLAARYRSLSAEEYLSVMPRLIRSMMARARCWKRSLRQGIWLG